MMASVSARTQGEEALAQREPDPLDRVEFGAAGGQWQPREGVGDAQGPRVMPAGAVEPQHGMDIPRQLAAKRARKRSIRPALTRGRTGVKSSPVAGRTAVKMETGW
jgi:hypothetical protein